MMLRMTLIHSTICYLILCSAVVAVTALSTGYTPPTYRSYGKAQHTHTINNDNEPTQLFAINNDNEPTQLFANNENDNHLQPFTREPTRDEYDILQTLSSHSTRRMTLHQMLATVGGITTTSFLPSSTLVASATPAAAVIPTPPQTRDITWPLGKVAFSLLPLAGSYSRRATVIEELVNDRTNGIWTLDQIQGVVNVNVPVRMVVIKLSPEAGGGLWIHNPLAPTPQLISYLRQLEAEHGPVRHIVLGTVALEHKSTFGPFGQYFTKATCWIQPGQWSFPVQLPIEFLGVAQSDERLRILPSSQYLHGDKTIDEEVKSLPTLGRYRYWAKQSPVPEWTVDIDYETLEPLRFKSVGTYSETAFFHKPTKSLIVTDCVCSVTKDPPKIIEEDPRAMLFHARDSINDIVVDDEATRQRGWRRMVQFGLVFFPSQIDVVPAGRAIKEASKIDPSMKSLGEGAVPGSLYPWTWHDNDVDLANFNAISQNGKLFCPPILTKLILDREPQKTLDWVDRIVTRFQFTHVIPGHLNNYVKTTGKEFSQAFDPLRNNPKNPKLPIYPQRALAEDLALLQEASDLLTDFGVVAQSQICDLEPARQVGRFKDIAPK